MHLKVGQLEEHLAKREETAVTAKLGDFVVNDDASILTVVNHGQHHYPLDEVATTALTKYLKVPKPYYSHLTPDFRAEVLRYEFNRKADADTVVEAFGDEVVAVHQPSQLMLPTRRVAEVVGKTFKPDDTVRRMITNEKLFHLDVTTDAHTIAFLPPAGEEGTTLVGDVTEAGMRFLAHPFRSEAPSVGVYAERLICMNGQTTPERLGRITIKGRTVDEVIAEMEEAAGLLMPQLDDHLAKLAATREIPVPGSPQAFAAQLAREANVTRQVLDSVLAIINQLPEPVSVWDVNQAFTSVANQAETYATMTRLQALGGQLAFNAEEAVRRCKACERKL